MSSAVISPAAAPAARPEPKSITLHGVTLTDDYAWLRDKSSPETLAYLNAENAYTDAFMAPTAALQKQLYDEMLSHIKETDESVPYPMKGFFYYTRTVAGLQYPIHCRRAALEEAAGPAFDDSQPEEVLLDVNKLAEGQPFMAVGSMAVTPSGTLLAYTTDNTGFRQYNLHIRNLMTGEDLPDTALRVGSIVWAADSKTLFYTTEDEVTKRHDHLFRHTLGESVGRDAHVFHEPDERFNLGIGKTRDGQYLMIESGSHTTNEYHLVAADTPAADFKLIAPRLDDQEYYPEHRDGILYIRTNDTGRNFRLVTAPVSTPDRENWTELFAVDEKAPLEDFDLFQTFLVTSRRELGLPVMDVYAFGEGIPSMNPSSRPERSEAERPPHLLLRPPTRIAFPEPTYSAGPQINREFNTTRFRYSYQSLVSPASVYEYDTATAASTLLKMQEVPGGFDPALYGSERVMITAADGVEIPVSLVYRRVRFHRGAKNPLYVYGYGSYGYALPVNFSGARLSLLDRGLVLAYAHIRGGGEMGDPWHDAGKMVAKLTTFTDFTAAVEQLTAKGYGDPARVAIEGGSAGGLLMGAVVNQRPELFKVVLSHVPFVDVMNTMLDATLPLTVAEYEEWGNPNEPEAFAYMLSYSPYDNLKPGSYPAMLVKTSLNDSQVMYWEPAKYVAKLRTLKRNDTPLLLHVNMDAGHGGASGRYDYLKEIAFDYAFLLTQLGLEGAS
jgi:oligopeptidase B